MATGFANTCGVPPPSASKSASPSFVTLAGTVDFTITINNTSAAALTVTSITDTLPAGFTFDSDQGGSLVPPAPARSPSPGSTGNITWTFSGNTVPAGGTRTFIFRATAAGPVGTYSNTASVVTSAGTLTTDPAQVGIGAPRLTIAKAADAASRNPGENITYTIAYSNDSPVNVTGAQITDALPLGMSFVSSPDCTESASLVTCSLV